MTTTLVRSKDRKVANAVNPGGTAATIANSFGLPSGSAFSCPGATSFCERICYAGRLERGFPGVLPKLMRNFEALQAAGEDHEALCALLRPMIAEFVVECAKRTAPPAFRIHWDGDFYSIAYARAWAAIIAEFPGVRFWAYTRSFEVVPVLVGLPNLALYLSSDPVNAERARAVAAQYGVPIAAVADTFALAREQVDTGEDAAPVYACPENGRRIDLINTKGSACIRCGICPNSRGSVLFATLKR